MNKLNVPSQIETALKAILLSWMQEVCRNNEYHGSISAIEVSDIEHNYREGYIPFTNGGYIVSEWFDLGAAYSSGKYFNQALRDFADKQSEDCFDMFKHDNNLDDELSYSDMDDATKESFWDYENEWMTQSYYIGTKAQCYSADNYYNPTKEKVDCILVQTYYNLSEYGDERRNTIISEKIIPLSELTGSNKVFKLKEIKDTLWQHV